MQRCIMQERDGWRELMVSVIGTSVTPIASPLPRLSVTWKTPAMN